MREKNKKDIFLYTIPLVAWTLLMITVSSIPGKKLPEVHLFQWDKLAHSFEFFIFTLLFARYLYFAKHFSIKQSLSYCLSIGIVYAVLDEVHQLFIPNRCCTWQDFLADSLGIVVGCIVAGYYLKRKVLP